MPQCGEDIKSTCFQFKTCSMQSIKKPFPGSLAYPRDTPGTHSPGDPP